MTVDLYDEEGQLVWTGPLAEFLADNEIDGDDVEAMKAALEDGGVYTGGGGAAPWWTLRCK